MDYCAKHQQYYNERCAYCGTPQPRIVTGTTSTGFFVTGGAGGYSSTMTGGGGCVSSVTGLKPLIKKIPIKMVLTEGLVNVTAKISADRITIQTDPGQTELDFNNRKVETIENLARCMLKAVHEARKLKG